jgi:hypothetical protein
MGQGQGEEDDPHRAAPPIDRAFPQSHGIGRRQDTPLGDPVEGPPHEEPPESVDP